MQHYLMQWTSCSVRVSFFFLNFKYADVTSTKQKISARIFTKYGHFPNTFCLWSSNPTLDCSPCNDSNYMMILTKKIPHLIACLKATIKPVWRSSFPTSDETAFTRQTRRTRNPETAHWTNRQPTEPQVHAEQPDWEHKNYCRNVE